MNANRERGSENRAALVALAVLAALTWRSASAQAELSIAINGVESAFNPTLGGYDVTAYFGVADAGGMPISGLDAENIAVSQDGVAIDDFNVEPVEVGISMVLAIDTSGSMASAGKIDAVRQAAASFIGGLGPQDEIGLMSFNEIPKVEINITEDRAAVQNFVNLLEPVQGASTCLWDSAFEAVELAAAAPAGRRAVVLLTDGIDELASGGACSAKTLEDVLQLASDPAVLVPVYAVGIGNRINGQELARLSDLTGGRTSIAANADDVGDVFNELGLQFRGGYAIRYRTDTTSGEHTLFIQVEHAGIRDQDTRKFRTPELAGQAIFSGIGQDQVVTRDLAYSLEVSSSIAPDRVEFYIDDQLMSQDLEPPFEERLPAELGEGLHTLRAVVYAAAGEVLAVAQIGFVFEEPEPEPTEVPLSASISFVELSEGQRVREAMTLTAEVDNQQAVARVEFRLDSFPVGEDAIAPYEVHWDPRFIEPGPHTLSVVIIGPDGSVLDVDELSVIYDPPTSLAVALGVPILIAAVAGGVYAFIRRRRQGASPELGSISPQASPSPVIAGAPVRSAPAESAETLAALTVEACQDPELIGQRFEIWEEMVVIGRSSECEIVIPAQPVSRKHATIQLRAETAEASLTVDEILLDEQAASGPIPFQVFDGDPRAGEASTYGTFVDNVRAQPDAGLPLASDSRIRLGRSQAEGRVTPVVLRFEDLRKPESQVAASEMTTDILLEDAESGAGIDSAVEDYRTEDFSLTEEEDDLKTEEFGPEADQ